MTEVGEKPVIEIVSGADKLRLNASDREKSEYFVRVAWLDTVAKENAFDEVGLFGNQNTVCQPTAPKWRHTIERLKTAFVRWNDTATEVREGNLAPRV